MAYTSPGSPLSRQCFTDKSADETLGPWIDVRGYPNVVFYLTSTGTTSGGVISFEESAPKDISVANATPPPTYGAATGNYSLITTKNASDFSGDAQVAIHLNADRAYCFVRARISSAITGGGTVSANCVAS